MLRFLNRQEAPPANDAGFTAQRALRPHPFLESVKNRSRAGAQHGLDVLQLRVDAFPRLLYQPLPWIGMAKAGRAHGTNERWARIGEKIDALPIETALDIGCQAGFFTISLAERGIATLGVDVDERSLRMARYAAKHAEVDHAAFANLQIDPDSVGLLPHVDVVLLLSVWHHWVFSYGVEGASSLLRSVWDRCGSIMFFETGQQEMPPEFGLPTMGADPEDWIARYLAEQCSGATIEPLGRFQAFGVDGNETKNVAYRSMFALTRTD